MLKKCRSKKISVAFICGGQSPEHEISLLSAQNILLALNTEKFAPFIIYISKTGTWHKVNQEDYHCLSRLPKHYKHLPEIFLSPASCKTLSHPNYFFKYYSQQTKALINMPPIDIAFPVLHGQLGEDGAIQGIFKMLNLPFAGNDVLSSAISMDKDIAKRLLSQANILNAQFIVIHEHQKNQIDYNAVIQTLRLPFFLKPANTGSSIGVYKIKNKSEFEKALSEVFQYDSKIILEEYIAGRELECAILGNENPIVSVPGEIVSHHEFYSYEAKYIDQNGADIIIPAALGKKEILKFQAVALKTYQTFCCSGLARIDFFYSQDKKIYVNELNTLPGFTNISMYPKCFEHSGITYSELIEKLILLGLAKKRVFD